MKLQLKLVKITGFRSIEDMELSFSKNGHKILVGKNESGKSNILKALSLLSGSENITEYDKKEQSNSDMCIKFFFDVEQDTLNNTYKKLLKEFFVGQNTIITDGYSIKQFCSAICSTSMVYEVNQQSKTWVKKSVALDKLEKDILSENLTLKKNNWYHLHHDFFTAYPDFKKILPDTISYLTKEQIIQFTKEEQQQIIAFLSPITLKEIYQNLEPFITESIVHQNDINISFPVIKWQYNTEKHDLPPHLDKNKFASDPNIYIPLKNMFLLSGIQETDIGKEVSEKSALGFNPFKNLLNKVNKKTNEYIKNSWKEFINVKLELRESGSNIVIGIQDSQNTFDFRQRSDGFRRLISFLLLMSVEEQESGKQQKLILIDEPEVGLHPSSARDLKNKLIDLGKNNWVVYATHSISMIDTDNIENNLIVSRDNENTTVQPAKEDGTSSAETVYQAIGYSIYEELKQKNILLEGHTDKQVFKKFMTGSDWKNFGICYTGGVKNIQAVISTLDLVNRKYFILSDSDKSAKQEKKKMRNPRYWYTYTDLGSPAITVEDFYSKSFFLKVVKGILKSQNINNIDVEQLPENNRLEYLKQNLTETLQDQNRKEEDVSTSVKNVIREIKDQCVQKMNKDSSSFNQEKIKKVLNKFLAKIK